MTTRRTFVKTAAAAGFAAAALFATQGAGFADELEALKEKGTIRIAMSGAYPPFNFVNEQNEVVGFDPAIGTEIAKRMGLETEIVTTAWDGIIGGLLANKYDAIVGSMSITEERMKTIDFSDKYYNTPSVIAAAKGSGITPDADGLKDKIVGVQVSTIHQDYVTTHFGDAVAEIKEYQTQDEANQDLVAGRVDAIMADSLALDAFVKSDAGGCCEIVGAVEDDPAILGAGVGVGLRKGDDALKEKFNAAIDAIRANGKYTEINDKYFDFDAYGG